MAAGAESLPQYQSVFDLRVARQLDYRNRRIFRYLFSLGGLAVLVEVVGRLVYSLLTLSVSSGPMLAALIGIPLAFVLLWVSTTFRPGAIKVTIGPDGVRFLWPDGVALTFSWNDSRLRLTLWRFIPQAGDSSSPRSYLLVGGFDRRMVPLSDEAFEAILFECRKRALAVSEYPGSSWAPPKSVIVVRCPSDRAMDA